MGCHSSAASTGLGPRLGTAPPPQAPVPRFLLNPSPDLSPVPAGPGLHTLESQRPPRWTPGIASMWPQRHRPLAGGSRPSRGGRGPRADVHKSQAHACSRGPTCGQEGRLPGSQGGASERAPWRRGGWVSKGLDLESKSFVSALHWAVPPPTRACAGEAARSPGWGPGKARRPHPAGRKGEPQPCQMQSWPWACPSRPTA